MFVECTLVSLFIKMLTFILCVFHKPTLRKKYLEVEE